MTTDNEALRNLLLRLRQWDHLDSAADGPFWKREIDAALSASPQAPAAQPVAWRVCVDGLWLHAASKDGLISAIRVKFGRAVDPDLAEPLYAAPPAQPQAPAAQPVGINPMQNPMRPAYFMNYAKDETPAEMVLRKLACWLGVGGYNAPTVDADLFHRKIVDGIESLLSAARSMPASPPAQPQQAATQEKP